MPAATVAAGLAPVAEGESGCCVCFCGGYSMFGGAHSHAQVTGLHISPPSPTAPAVQPPLQGDATALALLQPGGASSQLPLHHLQLSDFALIGSTVERRRHATTDWAAMLARAKALPRGPPGCQAVVSWHEMRVRLGDPTSMLAFAVQVQHSVALDRRVLDFMGPEPTACDVARCLLLSLVAPPGEPALPRPCTVLFAARVGGATMRALAPLLELLQIAPQLEAWTAAALSSLVNDTNPHGYNAVRRCVHCKRAADGRRPAEPQGTGKVKLRSCAACGLVSYCGSECQHADWPQHKEMCRYAVDWKKQS